MQSICEQFTPYLSSVPWKRRAFSSLASQKKTFFWIQTFFSMDLTRLQQFVCDFFFWLKKIIQNTILLYAVIFAIFLDF